MIIETVAYQINWAKFRRGYSFFIPCINVKQAREELRRVTKRLDISIVTKIVIEDGVKGLRIWRT